MDDRDGLVHAVDDQAVALQALVALAAGQEGRLKTRRLEEARGKVGAHGPGAEDDHPFDLLHRALPPVAVVCWAKVPRDHL